MALRSYAFFCSPHEHPIHDSHVSIILWHNSNTHIISLVLAAMIPLVLYLDGLIIPTYLQIIAVSIFLIPYGTSRILVYLWRRLIHRRLRTNIDDERPNYAEGPLLYCFGWGSELEINSIGCLPNGSVITIPMWWRAISDIVYETWAPLLASISFLICYFVSAEFWPAAVIITGFSPLVLRLIVTPFNYMQPEYFRIERGRLQVIQGRLGYSDERCVNSYALVAGRLSIRYDLHLIAIRVDEQCSNVYVIHFDGVAQPHRLAEAMARAIID